MKFNEVLRPYDLSGEQFNVLRILRGQNPANMSVIQERNSQNETTHTRLVDKLLLKNFVTKCV
jgi:DNA-binding MarR family transcriptional regulator